MHYRTIESFMINFAQNFADKLGIETRTGTDINSQPYKTDYYAHEVFFEELSKLTAHVQKACVEEYEKAFEEGRKSLKQDLKNLLEIDEE